MRRGVNFAAALAARLLQVVGFDEGELELACVQSFEGRGRVGGGHG